MDWMWLIWVAAGYLCGSIPFGLLIGHIRGVDLRASGSGNIGATNAGRLLGRNWGILCLALDILKGFGPVLAAGLAMGWARGEDLPIIEAWQWLCVAVMAVLGHVFPCWLRFKGGKGVATGLGVLLGLWPTLTLPVLAAVVTGLVMAGLFKYISLASVVAAVALPIYLLIGTCIVDEPKFARRWPFLVVTALLALLIVVRHRTNLARVVAGQEPKIGAADNDNR